MKNNFFHFPVKTFKPYHSMHNPTWDELHANYDYTKFPLSDIITVDWDKEISRMENQNLCPCGSGYASSVCHKDMMPGSAVDTYWHKINALDAKIQELKQENNITFLCRKNCNACCDYYFYISPIEYFAIKYYLLNTHKALFEKAKTTAKQSYEQLKEEYPEEYNRLEFQSFAQLAGQSDHEVLDRFKMCPFANSEKGICEIYSVRTMICRLFGTSYAYGYCNDIDKKVRKLFSKQISKKKVTSHMVKIELNEDLRRDVDHYVFPPSSIGPSQGIEFRDRAFPLIYWLTHDEQYSMLYSFALNKKKQDYWRIRATDRSLYD